MRKDLSVSVKVSRFTVVTLLLCFLSWSTAESLYSALDAVLQLNSSSFQESVFLKDNAWIVEFYSSWCGHCINFAPLWKKFAKDIQAWDKVVRVAVVNCADEVNVDLCRKYQVEYYPSIKYFWIQADENSLGNTSYKEDNITSLRHNLIDFLTVKVNESTLLPSGWPKFDTDKISQTVSEMWRHLPTNWDSIFVVIEPENSYIGREVILDLSSEEDLRVVRVTTSNVNLVEDILQDIDDSVLPVLVDIRRGKSPHLLIQPMFGESPRRLFVETLSRLLRLTTESPGPESTTMRNNNTNSSVLASKSQRVYMSDLENVIRYSLKQEVGVHDVLEEAQLKALKYYLEILIKYFPGRPPIKRFLKELEKWVTQRISEVVDTEVFLNYIDNIQSDTIQLPVMREWQACQGSKPTFRGYPCGVWMLFHTLTVQALEDFNKGGTDNPREVLFAMRDYVRNFFTCHYCARHFAEMAADLQTDLVNPNDTVLWLWRAHNRVNRRLAGDASEDPYHPKVQFPTIQLCPDCHIKTTWNSTAVMNYLMKFYGEKNFADFEGHHQEMLEDDSKNFAFPLQVQESS
ncbi:sulfhydryl oxidase 1-like isoform X2 [Limulus polyphemus]|uniref:Sulfhydryl oxidase n=1 Tax=Limulus polyphemus TaxID=6850 RepID=A0ABM1BE90_LIMPO|nr:sulfhydryl oxidase 1-like isoform X2 [Limulus polyphemus]